MKAANFEENSNLCATTDYLLSHPTTINTKKGPLIHLETLWPIVQEMGELWAAASGKGGTPGLGDVWPCDTIQSNSDEHWIPFHRLSQWMAYSLVEPMEKLLGATIEGKEQLTVLPEYRNGKYYMVKPGGKDIKVLTLLI